MEFAELKEHLAVANLDRLAEYEPPSKPPLLPGFTDDDPSPCDPGLDILIKWSKDNMDSIQNSIKNQAFGNGNPKIDWTIAFLPFMESCAVYLRDYGLQHKAWETYREYKQGGSKDNTKLKEALSYYFDADKDLETLAEVWGMQYARICDLVSESPEGHTEWDGPFCGAFCTTGAQKDTPLIGIAFKGTNPLRKQEDQVDFDYDLESAFPPRPFLNSELVSKGVYGGLFGKFKGADNDIAYKFIIQKLETVAQSVPNSDPSNRVRTHVTGHSLGGSYSQFCFAQLLIDATADKLPFPNFIVTGDQYTFGAPRVGCNDWAKFNRNMVPKQQGLSWRIVNSNDIVPQVPPTQLKPDQRDFIHLDRGMQIFNDKPPVSIPTEIDGPLPEPFHVDGTTIDDFINQVLALRNHIPDAYYEAMVNAIQSS